MVSGLLIKPYFFAHVDGERAIKIGYISSLPNNIAIDKTNFEISEYEA